MFKRGLLLSLVMFLVLSYVTFADNLNNIYLGTESQEAIILQNKIYSDTPFVVDMNKQIKLISPASVEEAKKTHENIYSDTPFIKEASPGTGTDYSKQSIETADLPYYFTFDFDSNLTSKKFDNNGGGTIRITANAEWEELPNEYEDSEFAYYDVTLHAGGRSQGTFRFKIGSWQHADWTNVPEDENMYFTLSKHVMTWSGAPYPGYNGDIIGSGTVLIP